MVDPNVLKTAESIPKNITVLHFGNSAMLLYQIGDIRMFYENDVRFFSNLKPVFKI
jgi:phenylalanyl-tRNA synthetase alpha subunit